MERNKEMGIGHVTRNCDELIDDGDEAGHQWGRSMMKFGKDLESEFFYCCYISSLFSNNLRFESKLVATTTSTIPGNIFGETSKLRSSQHY